MRTEGFEELMIVNPGDPRRPARVVLRRDGHLQPVHTLHRLGACERHPDPELRSRCRLGEVLLGDDGTLYRTVG